MNPVFALAVLLLIAAGLLLTTLMAIYRDASAPVPVCAEALCVRL